MKYDEASWHYGCDFPEDLPPAAAATHSGMFLGRALLAGLGGEIHTTEWPEELDKPRTRSITPAQFLINACDEKFTDEDLSDEGNAFAASYFDLERGAYISDYERTVAYGRR